MAGRGYDSVLARVARYAPGALLPGGWCRRFGIVAGPYQARQSGKSLRKLSCGNRPHGRPADAGMQDPGRFNMRLCQPPKVAGPAGVTRLAFPEGP